MSIVHTAEFRPLKSIISVKERLETERFILEQTPRI